MGGVVVLIGGLEGCGVEAYPNTAKTSEEPQNNQPAKPQHCMLRQNSK